jgi:hypothetical protein
MLPDYCFLGLAGFDAGAAGSGSGFIASAV